MHDEAGDLRDPRVEVFLDATTEPFAVYRPPARFRLDTSLLEDGPHSLRIVAHDGSGRRGVRNVHFTVRNGPGIAVDGVHDGDVVEGQLSLLVNAYGAGYEAWEPSRAETPAPIPTWTWVLVLALVAWAMFYAVRYWSGPDDGMMMDHAAPSGLIGPIVLGAAIVLVVAVCGAAAWYLLRPGERERGHIKRRILE